MKKACLKVSLIIIIINIVLFAIKLIAGILGNSSAMISDAIHSLSDVLSTFIVIVGLKISNKESDDRHQYGHERLENVASLILAFILLITGFMIGVNGLKNVYNNTFVIPNVIALIASIISIIVKEWMYWYTIIIAKKYNSDSLKADAWHHRSDALSSIGSLVGISSSMLGLLFMDVVAGIIIAIIIIKIAIEIFIDSINKMIDCSCDESTLNKIRYLVLETNGVEGIDDIKTRIFGNKIYIDLEIIADKNITFEEAHNIAHNVHDILEEKIVDVKHCMVHINPK